MAANDETAVDEQQEQPSNVERLADFIERALTARGDILEEIHGGGDESDRESTLALAEEILGNFFRVDVDAQHIFATPGVDSRNLDAFAMVMWGPMAGRLSPIELRSIAAAFLEVAETAEVESSFVRWLMREDGSNIEGAVKILQSFRQFRTTIDEPAGT